MAQGKSTFSPLSTNAYRIFAAELPQQLKRAQELIDTETGLNFEQARSLAAEFHTIKGGAGFFGLDEIYRLSGELEKTLLAFGPKELEQVRQLFAGFKKHAAEIPEPKVP